MGEFLGRVTAFFRFQLQFQRLWFAHKDWKIIVFTPWLPPAWTFQWLFLLYRWVLAIYFSGWLLYYAIESSEDKQGGRFFIYLSNWGFLVWMAYLILAAVAVTINFIRMWACSHVMYFPRRPSTEGNSQNAVCCNCERDPDNTNCCDKLTWFLFVIGAEGAVIIAILFWTTEYTSNGATGGISLHLHLVNAVVALIDLWVSGVPVFLLHFIYIQLFGAIYVCFTGMYYAFSENKTAIYQVLDYQSSPGLAAGLAVGMAVAGTAVIHLLFLIQYLCRRQLTARLLFKYKKMYRLSFSASSRSAIHNLARQHSTSPPNSSSSSSAASDTTPILAQSKQQSTHMHKSHESCF